MAESAQATFVGATPNQVEVCLHAVTSYPQPNFRLGVKVTYERTDAPNAVVGRRVVYTDGSFTRGAENAKAGFAVAMYRVDANDELSPLQAHSGRVTTNVRSPHFRGAGTHSNNSGELAGLAHAIEILLKKKGPVQFRVDSTYAMNVATGKFRPPRVGKGNWQLATWLRRLYRQLVKDNGRSNVSMVHVRAHAGEMGNEVADILAKEGAKFTDAEVAARNYKYMNAIAARQPEEAEPQHRSVPRRRREK